MNDIAAGIFDRLGDWSQIKHDILGKYGHAYTTIVRKQPSIRKVLYVDAYAGSGFGTDRQTGARLTGSAIRAMEVQPQFHELHFVEADPLKADILRQATRQDSRVTVHDGDGLDVLDRSILDRCRWEQFHRALCLLDPYDLSIPWSLVLRIAKMKSVEIFYNFMIMDANRNVLWKEPDRVPVENLPKMDLVWGDRSWKEACYREQMDLLGPYVEKVPNEDVAEAFRKRLQQVAGFSYVPRPVAMKNSNNATVYYLFFASHNATGARIVGEIFDKYR
jgi:three-Cys-motif partner protein